MRKFCAAAVIAAEGSLKCKNASCKLENDGLKQISEELMQKALSATQKTGGIKPDKILSSLPSGMLGTAIKAD